jgi:hypothetical protein
MSHPENVRQNFRGTPVGPFINNKSKRSSGAIHALWRLLNVASQTCAFIGFASSRGGAYSVGQFHHYYLSNKEGCNEN